MASHPYCKLDVLVRQVSRQASARPTTPSSGYDQPSTAGVSYSTQEAFLQRLPNRATPSTGRAASPMAAMAARNPPVPQEEQLGVPSRNPLPLSASQEAQVREVFYTRVRKQCGNEIKGEPSRAERIFALRLPPSIDRPTDSARESFNANPDSPPSLRRMRPRTNLYRLLRLPDRTPRHERVHEAARVAGRARRARVEWFSMRMERQHEREKKAKVAAAQEEFMREWWGLPEHVRLSRQKEMENRGEQLHGQQTIQKDHKPDEKTRR
ncbi:hypothetical protein G7046_g9148 [Stylonectria norvegica]|nr:hypothetical protein G7046_g9148 [Stylonectria norvegica]